MDNDENRWRAESDARTLADASVIRADVGRLEAAQTAASRLAAEEEKVAEENKKRRAAFERLAKGRYPSMYKSGQ